MIVSHPKYPELTKLCLEQNKLPDGMVKIIAKSDAENTLTIRGQIAEVILKQTGMQMLATVTLMNMDNVQAFKLCSNASVDEVPKSTFRLAIDASEILSVSICDVSERREKLPRYTCCIAETKPGYTPSLKDILRSTNLALLVPAEKPVVRSNECDKPIFDGPNDFLGGN